MIYTEVIPNPYNESGYVIVVYKKLFGFFTTEIGRCVNEEQLHNFMRMYESRNGKEL